MAIQIKENLGGGIIGLSMNASVSDSPAKLTVTKLFKSESSLFSSNVGQDVGINWNGLVFQGKVLSFKTVKKSGEHLQVATYIDHSVYLDQNCIVLHRRGLSSGSTPVTGKVTVTRLVVTAYSPQAIIPGATAAGSPSINFSLRTTVENYTVARKSGNTASGLGTEEFTTNPCETSQSYYLPNDALDIIDAPRVDYSARVAYEGTYRSVLTSIYNDVGSFYWWDWRQKSPRQAINKFKGLVSIPGGLPNNGCGIISVENGSTLEGTSTLSSWSYRSNQAYQSTQASGSIIKHTAFSVAPILHPSWPTREQLLFELSPAYKKYIAVTQQRWDLIDLLAINAPGSLKEFKLSATHPVWEKLGLINDWNGSLYYAVLNQLGLAGFPKFILVKQLEDYKDPSERSYVLELFYPYDGIARFLNQRGLNFVQRRRWTYEPAATRRGKNPFAATWEDQTGTVRIGHWRQSGLHVFSVGDLKEFETAVENCLQQISPDIFESLYLYFGLDMLSGGDSVYAKIRDGWQLFAVYPPSKIISDTDSGLRINPQDVPDIVGYVDPNTLTPIVIGDPNLELAEDKRCKTVVKEFESANVSDDTSRAPKPGIYNANGSSITLSCGTAKITAIKPSEANLQVVVRLEGEFEQNLSIGSEASNTWEKEGGISSSALNHAVVITNAGAANDGIVPSNTTKPLAGGTSGPLKTYSATTNGFYLPIVPTLQSLSASFDPDGLFVTYDYKDIPFKSEKRLIEAAVPANSFAWAKHFL